jgi:hypothetical protein
MLLSARQIEGGADCSVASAALSPTSGRLQERFQKEATMRDDWEELTAEVAAGAICPMPGCGAIGIAFRPKYSVRSGHVGSWEFTCPRCQIDFMASEQQFVFQSVPKEWLLAGIQVA